MFVPSCNVAVATPKFELPGRLDGMKKATEAGPGWLKSRGLLYAENFAYPVCHPSAGDD
jgi:hypothetical protein